MDSQLKQLEEEREKEKERFRATIEKFRKQEGKTADVVSIASKFVASSDTTAQRINSHTEGLSSLAEYTLKRERVVNSAHDDPEYRQTLKKKRRLMGQNKAKGKGLSLGGGGGGSGGGGKNPTGKLSFSLAADEDDEDDEDDADAGPGGSSQFVFKKKSLKNPTVDTSFLPDKERDEKLAKEQLLQRKLELHRQKELRETDLKVDFNFFDGTTHANSLTVKMQQTVEDLVTLARRLYPELSKTSIHDLLLVKANYIIPHFLSFYDLKELYSGLDQTGPFGFWSREEEKAHGYVSARIVPRDFFERSKHIYPYTKWRVFDEKEQNEFSEKLKEEKEAHLLTLSKKV